MTDSTTSEKSVLFLVPTPIGNLDDITVRAGKILAEVNVILAEDTRHTGKLLDLLGISNKLESYHQHNEHGKLPYVLDLLKKGNRIAYCSDAGTPGISDPGFLLVRACITEGIEVNCLPGATAFIPALVTSGLPCDRFIFEGFLPHKKGRQKKIATLIDEERTVVFYESPHRIQKMVTQLKELLGGERKICVSRELSKMHETHYRGTLNEVDKMLETAVIKGEFVVVVGGKDQ
ncbi:MAG: 16S rRNA (cytidine1402-2'-O)-methyltransferase [Bacteroidia bacterium]|jgi:16S rRNA (cytidine1402-2'-O)-methyltransferase